jgi:hypothetical protein
VRNREERTQGKAMEFGDLSIPISLTALGVSIFTLIYKEIGFKPRIEEWRHSLQYPLQGSIKTMEIEFRVRNSRKNAVYLTGATLQFHGIRFQGVRNLVGGQKLGFSMGADGDLGLTLRQEIEAGKTLDFHFEVDLDDDRTVRPVDVILMNREDRISRPHLRVSIREYIPWERSYEIWPH